jgi:hypothetical protein
MFCSIKAFWWLSFATQLEINNAAINKQRTIQKACQIALIAE